MTPLHRTLSRMGCLLGLLCNIHPLAAKEEGCRSPDTIERAAVCVERGKYKPCDLGSATGVNHCGTAYAEVAERKIQRLEKELMTVFEQRKLGTGAINEFKAWQSDWRKFRVSSCLQSDKLAEAVIRGQSGIFPNGTDFHIGFCMRRMNEVRVDELKRFLKLTSVKE